MNVSFHYGKLELEQLADIDVIVSPSDGYLSGSGGLDAAIHQKAGAEMEKELAAFRPIEVGKAVMTSAGHLGCRKIVHAAVPMKNQDFKALESCYYNILFEAARQDNHPKRMAITLIGTGVCGWSAEESMKALWNAMLRYQREHGSSYFGFASIAELVLYYAPENHKAVYPYQKRRSQAFFETPKQWGTRGDPYFWYDLMFYFDNPKFDLLTLREFIYEVQRFFHQKSGEWLSETTQVYLKDYAHGGMTSGTISGFMAQIGLPLLIDHLVKLNLDHAASGYFIIPVKLKSFHAASYSLELPYHLLEDLEFLRTSSENMNEKQRISLDDGNYFLSIYHYKGNVTLVDRYVLETPSGTCYEWKEAGAAAICAPLRTVPAEIASALQNYLQETDGRWLEQLVKQHCTKEYTNKAE